MTRGHSVSLLLVLLLACTTETAKPASAPTSGATASPSATLSETPPTDDGERLRVTAEQASALGLPPLPFSLVLGDSGLGGSGGHDGDYLTLSGPPGGVLMLRAYPAKVGDDLRALVAARHPEVSELRDDHVELRGVGRQALTWVQGESHARNSTCAFIVGPPGVGVGGPALLLELAIGANEAGCASSRDALAPVLESLRFD